MRVTIKYYIVLLNIYAVRVETIAILYNCATCGAENKQTVAEVRKQ